jgi:2-polyprenyl-3-methyl-5-hydroxy-6-metoxy-1,4-benzoquinol methylase
MEDKKYIQLYEVETEHWWFVTRKKILAHIIDKKVKKNKNSTLLDFGCGTGGNLDELSKKYNTYGADMSELAISFCKKRNLNNIFTNNHFFNNVEYKGKFDIITILDVIEHVDEDQKLLESLKDLLTDDGSIVITVPAYQFLFGSHDIIYMHKRRYIKKTLMKVVENSGYQIYKFSYFNTILAPLIILRRFLDRGLKKQGDLKDYDEVPNKFVNNILKAIFGLEKYTLPYISMPFGISILCIAKKK